jgi:hypothetical protein
MTTIPTENEYHYYLQTGTFAAEVCLEKEHAALSKKLNNRQLTFDEFLEYKMSEKTKIKEEPLDDCYNQDYNSQLFQSSVFTTSDVPCSDVVSNVTTSVPSANRNPRDMVQSEPSPRRTRPGPKSSKIPPKCSTQECFYCQHCMGSFHTQTVLDRHIVICPKNVVYQQHFEFDNMESVEEDNDRLCTVESYCSLQVSEGFDPFQEISEDQDPLCILPD